MAILTVREKGDPCLTKVCKEVKEITPRIKELIGDLFDTMYEAGGVGLAAPQVGILKRVVVIDTTPEPEENGKTYPPERYAMINPVITEKSGEQRGYEGCLSYPGMSGIVTRPMQVTVRFTDENGDEYTLEATDLLARAICHELDHLDGIMYTERAEGEVLSNEEIARRMNEKKD